MTRVIFASLFLQYDIATIRLKILEAIAGSTGEAALYREAGADILGAITGLMFLALSLL